MLSFQGIFINFLQCLGMSQNVLHVELIEHESYYHLSLSSLQNVSIFLCSNVLFNHIAICKTLSCNFHGNLYIKVLFSEIVVYLWLAIKQPLSSVNGYLIY